MSANMLCTGFKEESTDNSYSIVVTLTLGLFRL